MGDLRPTVVFEGLGCGPQRGLMQEAMSRHRLELPLVTAVADQMAKAAKDNPDKDCIMSVPSRASSQPDRHMLI